MLTEIIKELRNKIADQEETRSKKAKETRSILENKESTDEEIASANKAASEVRKMDEQIEADKEKLRNYEATAKTPDNHKEPEGRKISAEDEEKRSLNLYIHSKGKEVRDGITSPNVAVTIPESIIYNPENEVKSVTDLSKLVQHFTATTASGNYPMLKRATATLNTVEELAANPELAKPEFDKVSWEVKTYRGAIPISNESIQDSAIDLTGLVARNAQEQKINTTNAAISTVLKSFTPKTVAGESVDDIKHILNVDLDPAYNKVIVASQSFYNYLDTLKDKNGQYLLHQPIADGSPVTLLGVPVTVVEDTALGKAGEAHAWIGDLKRAVVMADRLDIQVKWVDNEIFGEYLQVATRFDVEKADEKAGYFVTQDEATPSA
ncbi:phage major capsid protein [Companilactobacillus pabuli]|uniref:phage major capsid protein n=1 Tax=Companilactobacillus pabuli TaxID=2714036 RepID=UPI0024181394|nr:phage major capsid protein [Companilactobacillus pabuli]MDG5112782.1 phage major capsid protein [Companilactobacillus pabuli]